MAVFTGKQILRAVFTNNSNDTIEVIYNHKDEGESPEYISVWVPATDPTNYELIGLKEEGWSLERIQRETHAYLEEQKQAHDARMYKMVESKVKEQLEYYYKVVNEEVNARLGVELEDTKQKIAQMYEQRYNEMLDTGPAVTTNVLQAVLDNNTDEDILFKTKLAVFDIQKVKDLKDRATKQKIRTAKSLMELFGALGPVLEES